MADPVEVDGVVVELLPSALYRIELHSRHRVTAHLSADPRKNFIRLLVGDRVRVRLSPHDRSRGCVVSKLDE